MFPEPEKHPISPPPSPDARLIHHPAHPQYRLSHQIHVLILLNGNGRIFDALEIGRQLEPRNEGTAKVQSGITDMIDMRSICFTAVI